MTYQSLIRHLPVAALIRTAGFAMQGRAGSIVSEGGFESAAVECSFPSGVYSGDIGDGWTVTNFDIQICSSGSGGAAHSGTNFVYLDYSNTVNTLSQTLATAAGQSYEVSYWVADNFPNLLSVDFGSQVLFNGDAPTNGVGSPSDYVNYTYTATANSTSTVLSFNG